MNPDTSSVWPLPDIPDRQIVDFDIFNIKPVEGDLHAGFHAFHQGDDILYTPANGGHWVPTSADLFEAIYFETELFSNTGVTLSRDNDMPFKPGSLDPPEHTAYRRMLAPDFMPARLRVIEDSVRQLTSDLIERVVDSGGCDFQEVIGEPLPVQNFLSYVNLPVEDAKILLPHGKVITRSADPQEVVTSFTAFQAYVAAKLEERAEAPTDDFIGRMAVAEIDGKPLSIEDRSTTAMNVILGGLDTTGSSMGFAMNFLARNPDHRQQIADNPAIIRDVVEEMLRRHGILNPARLVTRDCEFYGIRFRERDLILLAPSMPNTDERRFPEPLKADFARKNKKHFTFGRGIHNCIGMHFGRLQLRIMLEEWFKRIPDFSLAADADVSVASGRSNTVLELPLVW